VKTWNYSVYLLILFFMVSVFIAGGCTKKVSKIEMGGQVMQDEVLEEEEAVEIVTVEPEEIGGLFSVFFDYDRYTLREDTRETLKRNAEWLKNKSSIRISIQGHADERGSNEYNLALGDRRARTVKMYLTDLGVTAELSTVTFGEERPVCLESVEECWSKNRRAEFVVLSD
jgi:peptidoglycan-associated lipoprotein